MSKRETIRFTDPRLDESNELIFAQFLQDLKDPVEKAQLAVAWRVKHGKTISEALEVSTIIINIVPQLLDLLNEELR